MTHVAELPRVFAALACSGVFWLTAALILDGRVSAGRPAVAAGAIMIMSAFLFLQTLVH